MLAQICGWEQVLDISVRKHKGHRSRATKASRFHQVSNEVVHVLVDGDSKLDVTRHASSFRQGFLAFYHN